TARGVLVFSEFPFALIAARQVILAGRHYRHASVLNHSQGLAEKFQILFKRVVPAAPLPGDGPSLGAVGTLDPLNHHPSFVNGPLAHRLSAMLIFGDDR